MVHADAVGDRDRRKLPWRAAGRGNPLLRGRDLEIMGHVAGRLLALHADHSDHRPGDGLVIEPHRTHEGTVRRPIETFNRHARAPPLHTIAPFSRSEATPAARRWSDA